MLNLTEVLTKIGSLFVRDLQNAVKSQTSIEGYDFQPVERSTQLTRASDKRIGMRNRIHNKFKEKKYKSQKGESLRIRGETTAQVKLTQKAVSAPTTRLLFKQRFLRGAFVYYVLPSSVRVAVSREICAEYGVTYLQIVRWNDRHSPVVNPKVKVGNRPLIFPSDWNEVQKMKSCNNVMRTLKESVKQAMDDAMRQDIKHIVKTIEIPI